MRWEITDYIFTMRISFFKRKRHNKKRCQTFWFFRPVGEGKRKRRLVDHLLEHVCQIVVCVVLTSIIAVFSAVNWCWRLSAGLSKAHRNLATQHSASSSDYSGNV